MADKQVLMQLVNMLSGTFQNIGQQRQQGSQFRAGMQQDKARMDFAREQESNRVKSDLADRKLRLDVFNQSLKEFDAEQKIIDLGVQKEAEAAEFAMKSESRMETTGDVTKRGAEQLSQGRGEQSGVLAELANLVSNLGPTARIAAAGPQEIPGMTRGEFIASEQSEGVPLAALGGLPEPKPTNYADMKAAFDMSIVYGVNLPPEYAAMPGVVAAVEKGKVSYAQAQTDAEKMGAIEMATAEANLQYVQYKAKHPGGTGGPPGVAPSVKGKSELQWFITNGIPPSDTDLEKAGVSREQWGAMEKTSVGGEIDWGGTGGADTGVHRAGVGQYNFDEVFPQLDEVYSKSGADNYQAVWDALRQTLVDAGETDPDLIGGQILQAWIAQKGGG